MSRQAQGNAQKTYNSASDLTSSSENRSNGLYDELMPTFKNEAVNPQGFSPTEMSDFNTAAQQSAGGALGAATSKATQYAAANRNSGSFAPVLDEASRAATRNLTGASLGVKNEDAALKESQRQSGLAGLGSLQSQSNNDVLSSLGLQTQANNSLIDAGKSGWFQNMLGFMNAAAGDAKGAADLGMKV